MKVKIGSFTGNGATNRHITGIGFKPDLVIVKSPTDPYDTWFRTKEMVGDFALPMRADQASSTNRIPTLDADGFSVGSDASVNDTGKEIIYVAIKDDGAEDFSTVHYIGNANDDFLVFSKWQPDFAFLKSNTSIVGAEKFRGEASQLANQSSNNAEMNYDGSGNRGDLIYFGTDGLRVSNGSNSGGNLVNVLNYDHYGFIFKNNPGVVKAFSYNGNGVAGYSPINLGFRPGFLNLRSDSGSQPAVSYSSDIPGYAMPWDNSHNTNVVNSFTGNGFTLGTDISTNGNGTLYYGVAVYDPNFETYVPTFIERVLKLARLSSSSFVTTLKTITGITRIQAVALKSINGITRITATSLKTITGVTRITITTLKTISGVTRISVLTNKTISGIVNIKAITQKTITGVLRVQITTLKTIPGLVRITDITQKSITGLVRITISTQKTIFGIVRITVTTLQTVSGIVRITQTTLKIIPGITRITQTTLKTISGMLRVSVTTLKTIPGIIRITQVTSKTISGIVSISSPTITTLKTIVGLCRITVVTTKSILGTIRIRITSQKSIAGIIRIGITSLKSISGVARITSITQQTITGITRVSISSLRSINGVSRITQTTVKSIQGKMNIAGTTSKTISGVCRISVKAPYLPTLGVIAYSQNSLSAKADIDHLSSIAYTADISVIGMTD